MAIEATSSGIRITTNEPNPDGSWSSSNFAAFTGNNTIVDGVNLSDWHEIELRVTYVDGTNNDMIRIYLDGEFVGTTTTFENLRDAPSNGADHDANAELNQTNSLFFRPSASGAPNDGVGGQDKGFYFDDIVNVVYGNSSAVGNELDNTIVGNSGDNFISGLEGNDQLTGGRGVDVFSFAHLGADNRDTISDYVFGEGDTLDLSALLDGAMLGADDVSDMVRVTGDGAGLLVQVDVDGSANGESWEDVVRLENTNTGGQDPVRVFFDGVSVTVTDD